MPAEYITVQDKALQQYDAASHLLNVTFPLVKDPKLLLGVMHNIFNALELSMNAILVYERELQLLPPYQPYFQSRYNLFRYKSVPRNKIPAEIVNLIGELKEILDLQQKSPMEFQRGNKLVICSSNYHLLKSISLKELKVYLQQTRQFLDLTRQIIRFK